METVVPSSAGIPSRCISEYLKRSCHSGGGTLLRRTLTVSSAASLGCGRTSKLSLTLAIGFHSIVASRRSVHSGGQLYSQRGPRSPLRLQSVRPPLRTKGRRISSFWILAWWPRVGDRDGNHDRCDADPIEGTRSENARFRGSSARSLRSSFSR